MISFLRKMFASRIGTAIAIAFVALMGLAFALTDVSGITTGSLGGGHVARIGDQRIGTAELANAVDTAHQNAREEQPNLDRASFVRAGGLDGTLDRLITGYAIAAFAKLSGFGVSKAMIDAAIRDSGIGRGPTGDFDPELFRRQLASQGVSEDVLRDDIARTLYAEQLLTPATSGTYAPRSLVLPYAGLALERREGAIAIVPSAAFVPAAAPGDAVLADYYAKRQTRFMVPEQRVIAYAPFDASVVAAQANPSDAEVAAYYKANAARYAATETRDLAHVVAPTEAAARALADRVKAGTALAAAASGVGLAVVDSDDQSRAAYAAMVGDAAAGAAFGAAEGAIAGPVKGALGWYVLSVRDVTQQAARPLAAVRDEIVAALRSEKQAALLSERTTAMEEALIDGSSLAEVARANGLAVQRTPPVVGSGRNAKDPAYQPEPEVARIITNGFQIEEGGEPVLIEIEPGKRFAIVGVERVIPAAAPPQAEVKPLVQRAWALEQGKVKAKQAAEQVRKAVAGGTPLAAALRAAGAQIPPPRPVAGTRGQLTGGGRRTPPPVALMFALPQGAVRTLEAPQDQGWYVVHLTKTVEGNASTQPQLVEAARGEFARLLPDEYARQFAKAIEADVKVERNAAAIRTVREQFVPTGTQ